MGNILNSVLALGSLFIPAKNSKGVREVGVLPWSFAFMVLVSGSCLTQDSQPFNECTRDFISTLKGIVTL